jgi:3,4-dihydroxy 2-butanone 4-phosphate synthase/GTP cyclohydrolase II
MVRYTSGLICVPMLADRLDELGLALMVRENTDSMRTAFTVSVDYAGDTTTGISAHDRAVTIRALVDEATRPRDLHRPGHVFPLRYCEGGVLVRPGHTEAAVDLARAAGLYPAGVLCEVVNDDGTMARGAELEAFAKEHDIHLVSIADLIAYRRRTERLVRRVAETTIPTDYGTFAAIGYESALDGAQHVALVMGAIDGPDEPVLVRLHSECLTGDVFGSHRCDCGSQLHEALRRIGSAGRGVIVYSRGHEGRGIGLLHKLAAYALQDNGRDTVEANLELGFPPDARDYLIGAQILADLGVGSVRLLTNNPAKQHAVEEQRIPVAERIPLIAANSTNRAYLRAKAEKLGHLLEIGDLDA